MGDSDMAIGQTPRVIVGFRVGDQKQFNSDKRQKTSSVSGAVVLLRPRVE